MDNAEAFDKFKQCAVEVLQVDPEKVVLEARFADDLDAIRVGGQHLLGVVGRAVVDDDDLRLEVEDFLAKYESDRQMIHQGAAS